ncbi:hypothetical protein SAMN02745225_00040 [Ferrithrix thermotolerans DSM 19514]|uniref:Uncharacterized protein n=1 Tax=Ferrithrix thermotolerans DSM 19514 TaxID=1121881 RepID=A0A1M4S4V1_9ACTN|nr:hypothetical protein [Ferrithrix thermotolerans]SHE27225.1 hypothetical protein SAMN02745225_00040 [Ferrithrix thermotolerans DSM 19514]
MQERFTGRGLRADSLPKVSLILALLAFTLGWIPTYGVPLGIFLGGASVVFSSIGLTYDPSSSERRFLVVALVLGVVSVMLKFIPGLNVL